MSDRVLMILGALEILGLAGLFVYVRRAAKRRRAGEPRLPRTVRIAVALVGLLLVVAFPLLMISAIVEPATRAERQRDELRRSGTPANGVITHLEDTGNVVNHRPEMRVYMTVEPEGARPFDAEATWVFSVTDIQSYRVGTRVRVFFDPNDHTAVAVTGLATPRE